MNHPKTIRAHLKKHDVVVTVGKEARMREGQLGPMREWGEMVGTEEVLLFVLDPAYGTCHVTDSGEERWRCRYCE